MTHVYTSGNGQHHVVRRRLTLRESPAPATGPQRPPHQPPASSRQISTAMNAPPPAPTTPPVSAGRIIGIRNAMSVSDMLRSIWTKSRDTLAARADRPPRAGARGDEPWEEAGWNRTSTRVFRTERNGRYVTRLVSIFYRTSPTAVYSFMHNLRPD